MQYVLRRFSLNVIQAQSCFLLLSNFALGSCTHSAVSGDDDCCGGIWMVMKCIRGGREKNDMRVMEVVDILVGGGFM